MHMTDGLGAKAVLRREATPVGEGDTAMKPRFCDNIDAGVDRDGKLHFIFVNARRHLTVQADPDTVEVVSMMNGSRTLQDIHEALQGRIPAKQIEQLATKMVGLRLIRDARRGPSRPDDDRYIRQISFFEDFTEKPGEAQNRLAVATVAVIGIGTIGSAIAVHLARAGVGCIRTCDTDVVSTSNLPRNAIYVDGDVGQDKVDVAARSLQAIAPELTFEGTRQEVQSASDVEVLARGSDLVVNCADQPSVAQTGEWTGRASMSLGLPHILAGGYRTHLGFVGPTVIPGRSACWRCFEMDYHENDPFATNGWKPLAAGRPSGGSLGPLGAVVAGIHAWEAIRVLTGILPPVMINRKGEVDFTDLTLTYHDVVQRADCSECGQV